MIRKRETEFAEKKVNTLVATFQGTLVLLIHTCPCSQVANVKQGCQINIGVPITVVLHNRRSIRPKSGLDNVYLCY